MIYNVRHHSYQSHCTFTSQLQALYLKQNVSNSADGTVPEWLPTFETAHFSSLLEILPWASEFLSTSQPDANFAVQIS